MPYHWNTIPKRRTVIVPQYLCAALVTCGYHTHSALVTQGQQLSSSILCICPVFLLENVLWGQTVDITALFLQKGFKRTTIATKCWPETWASPKWGGSFGMVQQYLDVFHQDEGRFKIVHSPEKSLDLSVPEAWQDIFLLCVAVQATHLQQQPQKLRHPLQRACVEPVGKTLNLTQGTGVYIDFSIKKEDSWIWGT